MSSAFEETLFNYLFIVFLNIMNQIIISIHKKYLVELVKFFMAWRVLKLRMEGSPPGT
jgi:hypothetical protein